MDWQTDHFINGIRVNPDGYSYPPGCGCLIAPDTKPLPCHFRSDPTSSFTPPSFSYLAQIGPLCWEEITK